MDFSDFMNFMDDQQFQQWMNDSGLGDAGNLDSGMFDPNNYNFQNLSPQDLQWLQDPSNWGMDPNNMTLPTDAYRTLGNGSGNFRGPAGPTSNMAQQSQGGATIPGMNGGLGNGIFGALGALLGLGGGGGNGGGGLFNGLFGPGGGGGIGDFLSNILGNGQIMGRLGEALMDRNNASKYEDMANQMWSRADPFGGQRGQYQDQLSQLTKQGPPSFWENQAEQLAGQGPKQFWENMAENTANNKPTFYADKLRSLYENPNSIADNPGYQFRFGQGQQALERSMATKGYLGSGNMALALQKYGQDEASQEWANQVQQLGGLSNQEANQWLGQLGQFSTNQANENTRFQNLLNSYGTQSNNTVQNFLRQLQTVGGFAGANISPENAARLYASLMDSSVKYQNGGLAALTSALYGNNGQRGNTIINNNPGGSNGGWSGNMANGTNPPWFYPNQGGNDGYGGDNFDPAMMGNQSAYGLNSQTNAQQGVDPTQRYNDWGYGGGA